MACVSSQKTLPFPAQSPEAICLSEQSAPGAPAEMPERHENTANFQSPSSFWETPSRSAAMRSQEHGHFHMEM